MTRARDDRRRNNRAAFIATIDPSAEHMWASFTAGEKAGWDAVRRDFENDQIADVFADFVLADAELRGDL